MMWTSCAVLSFAPVFGFGIFCDVNSKRCRRYRDAEEPLDVAYAFIFFFIGKKSTQNHIRLIELTQFPHV